MNFTLFGLPEELIKVEICGHLQLPSLLNFLVVNKRFFAFRIETAARLYKDKFTSRWTTLNLFQKRQLWARGGDSFRVSLWDAYLAQGDVGAAVCHSLLNQFFRAREIETVFGHNPHEGEVSLSLLFAISFPSVLCPPLLPFPVCLSPFNSHFLSFSLFPIS